jgi:hypothetical protein
MSDRPLHPDTKDVGTDPGRIIGMPRWVKVSLIIIAVVIVAFVVLQLTGIAPDHGGNGSGHFGRG